MTIYCAENTRVEKRVAAGETPDQYIASRYKLSFCRREHRAGPCRSEMLAIHNFMPPGKNFPKSRPRPAGTSTEDGNLRSFPTAF